MKRINSSPNSNNKRKKNDDCEQYTALDIQHIIDRCLHRDVPKSHFKNETQMFAHLSTVDVGHRGLARACKYKTNESVKFEAAQVQREDLKPPRTQNSSYRYKISNKCYPDFKSLTLPTCDAIPSENDSIVPFMRGNKILEMLHFKSAMKRYLTKHAQSVRDAYQARDRVEREVGTTAQTVFTLTICSPFCEKCKQRSALHSFLIRHLQANNTVAFKMKTFLELMGNGVASAFFKSRKRYLKSNVTIRLPSNNANFGAAPRSPEGRKQTQLQTLRDSWHEPRQSVDPIIYNREMLTNTKQTQTQKYARSTVLDGELHFNATVETNQLSPDQITNLMTMLQLASGKNTDRLNVRNEIRRGSAFWNALHRNIHGGRADCVVGNSKMQAPTTEIGYNNNTDSECVEKDQNISIEAKHRPIEDVVSTEMDAGARKSSRYFCTKQREASTLSARLEQPEDVCQELQVPYDNMEEVRYEDDAQFNHDTDQIEYNYNEAKTIPEREQQVPTIESFDINEDDQDIQFYDLKAIGKIAAKMLS